MAERREMELKPGGEEDEKDAQRLEGQVRQLEQVLAQLTQLLEVERPMREQLMLIEAVGKAAVRLGALLRMQKQMKYMIFEVEDRIQRRKLAEERLFWSQNH